MAAKQATSADEKRKAQRVPLKVKVDYQFAGNFLFEYASDISQHGIFIETSDPLPLNSKVTLQFRLPDTKKNVEVAGEVIWVNSNQESSKNPGMGVKFTRINEIDKDLITSLIRRLAVL